MGFTTVNGVHGVKDYEYLLFFHVNKITSTYSEAYLLPAISREYNVKQKVSIKKSENYFTICMLRPSSPF